MGGFIAQTLALMYPQRVDKLILLSTDPGGIEADLGGHAFMAQYPRALADLIDSFLAVE